MKIFFVPAKINSDFLNIDKNKIKNFPIKKGIFIAYSIQYENLAKKIKSLLKSRINGFSQVLGCSKLKIPKGTQAILLISSGKFHAVSLAYENDLPVYLFEHNQIIKIENKEIEDLKKKKKVSYINFLNSKKIGILISTKPGQQKLQQSIKIKELLNKKFPDKEIYLFLSNEINFKEFENFEIDFWINSACPRLDFDYLLFDNSKMNNKIINIK